jgi:nitroimidazol reductase NimA-like FMN-containing flavoprotein (pyridoxamine 5'-phosphate oxidase superfamily)
LAYTQPPPLTNAEIESFLREQKIARICSLNEDGTIHVTAVWFTYKNSCIIIVTPAATRKVRNIKRNKNVTVFVDDPKTGKGVLAYGRAELDYNYNVQETVSLFEKYLPSEQAEKSARAFTATSKGGCVKITVKPEHIVSFDASKDIRL